MSQKWYCEHCHCLAEDAYCAQCARQALALQGDDLLLLTTTDATNVDILTSMLKSFDIQPLVQSQQGRGFVLSAGPLMENYRIYVPYKHYARACELMGEAWV